MDDKTQSPYVEKQAESELPAQNHPEDQGVDSKGPDVTNNTAPNENPQPSDTHNVAQSDIVDWEGEDDPAKPMNW
jgi:hypothetical protein